MFRVYGDVLSATAPASQQELSGLAGWVVGVVDALGVAGIGLLVAAENVFPPIPSEVILPLGGYLAGQGRLSFWAVLVAATVGSVLGALALYALGGVLGRERLRNLVDRLPLVEVADLDRAEGWFHWHGTSAVLIGRVIPVVRSLISVPAGVERMSVVHFLLLTTLGSTVWNALFVTLGFQVGERWTSVGDYSSIINAVVLVVLAGLLAVFVVRRLRSRP